VTFRVETEPKDSSGIRRSPCSPTASTSASATTGSTWGYELGSLILGVVEAGKRESTLRSESIERLAALEHDLSIDVFVTPT